MTAHESDRHLNFNLGRADLLGVLDRPAQERTEMSMDLFGMGNSGSYEQRKVANSVHGDLVVDTARVTDGVKPFETGIQDPRYNGGSWVIVEAYDSHEEAVAGHDKWVRIMQENPPEELQDCLNGGDGFFAAAMDKPTYQRKDRNEKV